MHIRCLIATVASSAAVAVNIICILIMEICKKMYMG